MLHQSHCPNPAMLDEVLLGLRPDTESEQIEQHVLGCPECIQGIRAREKADWLTEALRSGRGLSPSESNDPISADLLTRLQKLAPDVSASALERADGDTRSSADTDEAPGVPRRPLKQAWEFLAPAESEDELGRLGPYRVVGVLGTGGMGVVFHAEDLRLRRSVALKVMRPEVAGREGAGERFLREARALAAVEYEHVVPVYQVGKARNVPFLAMPLLKGESLETRLAREERLPVAEALRITREAALGLDAAHRRGLVHRDIKPGNVWLEADGGRVKLLDFGLVRLADDDLPLTHVGMIAGTPHCMSPEQARNEAVDGRSDLFSLGAVLYEMLTGKSPFRRTSTTATLLAVVDDHPAPPHQLNQDVPETVSALALALLEKNPDARPDSAQAVAATIEALERQPAGSMRPPHARRGASRRLKFLLMLVLPVLMLAAVVIHIRTNHGSLVIEAEDPRVEFLVRPSDATPSVAAAQLGSRSGAEMMRVPIRQERRRLTALPPKRRFDTLCGSMAKTTASCCRSTWMGRHRSRWKHGSRPRSARDLRCMFWAAAGWT